MKIIIGLLIVVATSLFANAEISIAIDDRNGQIIPWDLKEGKGVDKEIYIDKVTRKCMRPYVDTKTVIFYGEQKKTTYECDAKKVFDFLPAVTELIFDKKVPNIYFQVMPKKKRRQITSLSLRSYSRRVKKNPCKLFPKLQEITFEDTRMNIVSFGECRNIKRAWFRGNVLPVKINTKDALIKQVMQSVAHMSHAARTESIKLAQWSQVDRSGYYDDARVWEQVKMTDETNLDDVKIQDVLKKSLAYLEVAPCSYDLFKRIVENVDSEKVTLRTHFITHELVGNTKHFYIYIYALKEAPSQQIQTPALLTNTELGLRFDDDNLPQAWLHYVNVFTKLDHLKLDCKAGIVWYIIDMAKQQKVKPCLTKITLTISEKDNDPNVLTNVLNNGPGQLFTVMKKLQTINVQVMGENTLATPPSCTSCQKKGYTLFKCLRPKK